MCVYLSIYIYLHIYIYIFKCAHSIVDKCDIHINSK